MAASQHAADRATSSGGVPRPRPQLDDLPPYVAGRPPSTPPGLTPYKLSSNENPYPPLPGVLEAATAAVGVMERYPDMGNGALYRALAVRLDLLPAQISAGTGSTAVLFQLLSAFCGPGDEVVVPWRSFEAYPIAITVAGARAVQVPLTADARHDLDAMAAAVTDRTRVLVVCTRTTRPAPPCDTASWRPSWTGSLRGCWWSSTRRTPSSCATTTRWTACGCWASGATSR